AKVRGCARDARVENPCYDMQTSNSNEVIDKVRKALGRTAPHGTAPVPPEIDEPIARLVHMNVGLPELFAKRAEELKMQTEFLTVDDLATKLADYLREKDLKRIMISDSPVFERLNLVQALRVAGFETKRWSEITLDQAYDFDCAVTDTTYAVSEVGA